MAEKPGKNQPYRIDNADVRFLKGTKPPPGKKGPVISDLSTREVRVSFARVIVFCVVPLIPAVLLVKAATTYYRIIPAGDLTMRYLAVGLCSAFAGALVSGASYLFLKYSRKTITIEAKRLVVRDSDSLLAAGWAEVVVDPIKGGFVKTCVMHLAGRTRWIDSVFFPEFLEAVRLCKERAAAANAAMRDPTVIL